MPECAIVDCHVHLWDPLNFRMSWLDGSPLINKPFGPAEFRQHTAGLNIEAIVFVETGIEPHYAALEPSWVLERAQEDQRIQGIVAAAPLEHGECVRSFLKALTRIGPRVKGVRRLTQDEPDTSFCLRPDFVRGAQILPELGLTCDLCIKHWQLEATTELVRRCPQTQFMLDHIAKPNIHEHLLDPWREQMRKLAALPNVVCKVSGMVTEGDHANWKPEDLAPYVKHVLEVFGEDRVAFGGDWPVVLLASPYRRWVETLDALTAHLSAPAKRKLWAENARRFYRLAAR
ncbi:MAG: amidohydrolase family protein [Planctomycetota bacterium]|nr:amidohydrolase family protein [Planctomycetota bacterium]